MTVPANALRASRLLAEALPAHVPPPSDEVTARAIAALEAAIAQRRRRRQWTRGGLVAASVAAAAAVLIFFMAHARDPGRVSSRERPHAAAIARREPTVVAQPIGAGARVVGASESLADQGQTLTPGARVLALPQGRALLTFTSGSNVVVEEGGEVRLLELTASQVLALERGALRANVAKLGPGQRFVVRTEDAEIEVHGTSFRVATVTPDLACGAGSVTRLEVYEGVVSVRARGVELRVRKGERWPADCTPSPAVNTGHAEPAHLEPLRAKHHKSATPTPTPTSTPAHSPELSQLTLENDMFARATAARRAGDFTRAVDQLESLLANFPQGPLAQDAAAERMRLLQKLDRGRALDAARAYLVRYPHGFARADAEAILGAREQGATPGEE